MTEIWTWSAGWWAVWWWGHWRHYIGLYLSVDKSPTFLFVPVDALRFYCQVQKLLQKSVEA